MNESFLKDSGGNVALGLSGMNEQVVISTTKGIGALVYPDSLDVCPQVVGQPANDGGIFQGFRAGGIDIGKLGVYLHLNIIPVTKAGVEKEGVQVFPTIRPSIEHGALPLPGIGQGAIGRRVIFRDHVGSDEDRTVKGWLPEQNLGNSHE